MSQIATTELGSPASPLQRGGERWGKSYLDAVELAVQTWEEKTQRGRDALGTKHSPWTPAQVLELVVQRVFEVIEETKPIVQQPIPAELNYGARCADPLADILHDFLFDCQWARWTGLELALADGRSYARAGAVDRAKLRLQVFFDALVKKERLPPDQEVMALRIRIEKLLMLLDRAREKGFKMTLFEDELLSPVAASVG